MFMSGLLQAHVFFGPVYDYAMAPVARFSAVWKKPVITTGALASDFAREKKVEYPLLTRVGVTHETMCRGLRDAILYYEWKTVKVRLNIQCQRLMRYLNMHYYHRR